MDWTEFRINDFRSALNFSLQPSTFEPDQPYNLFTAKPIISDLALRTRFLRAE